MSSSFPQFAAGNRPSHQIMGLGVGGVWEFWHQTISMTDAAHALIVTGAAGTAQTKITGNLLFIDPASSGTSEALTLPPEADSVGLTLWIVNTGEENIDLLDDTPTTIGVVTPNTAVMVMCNGTTWRTLADQGGYKRQPTPTAETTSATLTVAELRTGIITGTHTAGGTQTYTLPTGTLMSAGATAVIGDSFDWTVINLSAAALDTITIAAGATHTLVGTAIIQSANASTGLLYGNAVTFRSRKIGATAWVTYRIGG